MSQERLMMSVDGYLALEEVSPGVRYEYLDGYAYLRGEGSINQMLEAASPGLRYEYLDGQLVMMSGGSLDHSLISSETIAFFIAALRGSSCRVFTSDARVKLSDTRYVYPDVTISCAVRRDPQNITEPTVAIEVLSPGTAAYDRNEKLQSYRECPSLQLTTSHSPDRARLAFR